MAKKLTDASVKAFRPDKSKPREIPDGGAKGLYLVIQPTGRKSFALRFRRPDRRSAKLTLGPLDLGAEPAGEPVIGAPLTLAGARTLAAEQLRQRALGVDIAARHQLSRQRPTESNTFPDQVKRFIADHAQRENRRWRETARLLGLAYPKAGGEPEIIADSLSARWRERDAGEITGDDLYGVVYEAQRTGVPGLVRRRTGWALAHNSSASIAFSSVMYLSCISKPKDGQLAGRADFVDRIRELPAAQAELLSDGGLPLQKAFFFLCRMSA